MAEDGKWKGKISTASGGVVGKARALESQGSLTPEPIMKTCVNPGKLCNSPVLSFLVCEMRCDDACFMVKS